MAKEYDAKLTLKDNFTAVIGKAIKATEDLRAKLDATQKHLTSLGKKKLQVGAKLDSSVKTTMNRLRTQIPKDRTIHLKAKDEVTRTMTNMQRGIFKLNRELNYGLKDPFGGLNRSAAAAIRNLAAMKVAARAVATGSAVRTLTGGSVTGAVAGGALAGRIARSGSTRVIPVSSMVASRVLRRRSSIGRINTGDPDGYEAAQRIHRMASGDVSSYFDSVRREMVNFDARFRDMIERQKNVMRQRFGARNYLSKYRVGDTGGQDAVEMTAKRLGRIGFAYQSAKRRVGEAAGNVAIRVKAITGSAESTLKAFVTRVKNSKLGEIGMRLKFAGERGMYGINNLMGSLRDRFSGIKNIIANVGVKMRDSGAGNAIAGLYNKVKGLAGKTFSFTVRALTSGASAAINALMMGMKGLGLAAGAIVIGGGLAGVKGAMEMEQNIVSIQHFVKYASQKRASEGKGRAMTDAEVQQATTEYMAKQRKYADITSFSTGDVMNAARRAVNVMQGDLAGADDLVKIAGDMAALNPGKTIMDAMEALADMKTGEMERMKEFGLKISAKEFKGLVGKGENDSLTDEETLRAYKMVMDRKLRTMFGGGAAKMGQTAGGKLSTLLGGGSSVLTDIGTMFLPGVKSGLDKAIAMIEGSGPKMVAAFKPMAEAFNNFMSGKGFGGVFAGFSASIQPALDSFAKLFKNIDLAKLFADTMGAVTAFAGVCWASLAPIINVAGRIIADVMQWIAKEMGSLKFYWQELARIFAEEAPFISDLLTTMWEVVKPALEGLWNLAKVIADVFIITWPGISLALKGMWFIVKPILQGLASFLQLIADGAENAHRLLKMLIDFKNSNTEVKVETPPADTSHLDPAAETDPASGRATGMNYIPYNGFRVSAHRGEAILSRTEADNWRAGSAGSPNITVNINDPVVREESDLERLGTMIAGRLSQVRFNMGGVPVLA